MEAVAKQFAKIGAEVKFLPPRGRIRSGDPLLRGSLELNVQGEGKNEHFVVRMPDDGSVELNVVQVLPADRHLLLNVKRWNGEEYLKEHFLCGHDERHLFVAGVRNVNTVAKAKESLKPAEIRDLETGLNTSKRNKRKLKERSRQGEWFFKPVADLEVDPKMIRKNEPLRRNGQSKPHVVEFAYRVGGIPGFVSGSTFHTDQEHEEWLKTATEREKKARWITTTRDPVLYAKGTVRHADHKTVYLDGWHRVYMNTETNKSFRKDRRQVNMFLD